MITKKKILFILLTFCILSQISFSFWAQIFRKKESAQVTCVDFSHDGHYYAIVHKDSLVRFFDAYNDVQIGTYDNGKKPSKVRFSRDLRFIGIGYLDDSNVVILNALYPFAVNKTINANHGGVTIDLDFSKSGDILLTCGKDKKAKTWNITNDFLLTNTSQTFADEAKSCRFQHVDTNPRIALTTLNQLFNLSTALSSGATSLATLKYSQAVYINSKIYASTIDQKNLYLFTPTQSIPLTTNKKLFALDISLDQKFILTAGQNSISYVLNYTAQNHSVNYQFQLSDQIWDAKFRVDGKRFMVGSKTKQFVIYAWKQLPRCDYQDQLYNQISKECQNCSVLTPKCVKCSDVFVYSKNCIQCDQGYYLNVTTRKCDNCFVMEGCYLCDTLNVCKTCSPGYVLSVATTPTKCTKCSSHMQGCVLCNMTSNCFYCLSDFYLEAGKCKACANISSNCLKCNSSSYCYDCKKGYYSNSGTCTKCDPLCLQCFNSSTNCTQCALGYYSNATYQCVACSYGCLTCNNNNFCFDCWATMYQKSDGTCQVCSFPCLSCMNTSYCMSCVEHYFLNASDNKCYRCQNGCNTCNQSNYCTSCYQGFYHVISLTNATINNTCRNCNLMTSNCVQCIDGTCYKCSKSYYIDSNTCKKCSSKMYQCIDCFNDTTCRQCNIGFYLTSTAGNLGNSSCAACSKSCQQCNSNVVCLKCFPGFYHQSSNNTCISCQLKHCIQCLNSSYCLNCQISYFLKSSTNQCTICSFQACYQCTEFNGTQRCYKCLNGYFLNTTNNYKCQPCSKQCISCSDTPDNCTFCNLGYYKQSSNNTCIKCDSSCAECQNSTTTCISCYRGYYYNSTNKKCQNCTKQFGKSCESCTSTNCLICHSGYYLTTVSPYTCSLCSAIDKHCLECNSTQCLNCSQGSYLDTTLIPKKCTVCQTKLKGCIYCSSSTVCQSCMNGYFLNSSKCFQCNIYGCQMCSSDGLKCLACSQNFFYNSTSFNCTLCQQKVQGCSKCNSSLEKYCIQCQNGYYLNIINSTQSECLKCQVSIAGCKYCNNTNICTKCMSNYYLQVVNATSSICTKCANKIRGCQLCKSDIQCLKCESGNYLNPSDNFCYLCQVNITGCILCSSNGAQCQKCQSGYYLKSSTKKCQLCSSNQQGCILCHQTASLSVNCTQCNAGYYQKQTAVASTIYECKACISQNCQICLQSDTSKCLSCDSGYYLITSNQSCSKCIDSINGCYQCTNSSVCLVCSSGYYLNSSSKKCQLCLKKFKQCQLCTQNECISCKGQFNLNPTSKICQGCSERFYGCKFCNQTDCTYCQNNYYVPLGSTNCSHCSNINGCILCNSLGECLKCKQNYLYDSLNHSCTLCSNLIPFCYSCLTGTQCITCQSGYGVDSNKLCQKLQASGGSSVSDTSFDGVKMITEWVNSKMLKHKLYVSDYPYKQIDLKSNLSDFAISLITTIKGIVKREPLTTLSYEWSKQNSQTLILYTNNPLSSLSQSQSNIYRRLLQQPTVQQGSSLLINTKSQIQMAQNLIKSILPDMKVVGDVKIKYDLNNPQFYASYIKNQNLQIWYFIVFGYVVVVFLVINYGIKNFKTARYVTDRGQIIPHYLALASPCIILYPTTVQMMSFNYGFMLLNFPWLNQYFGQLFSNPYDYSPNSVKLLFINLNIASTYLIGIAVVLLVLIIGYIIFRKKQEGNNVKGEFQQGGFSESKNKNKNNLQISNWQIYTNYVYNIFIYGSLSSAILSIQGCFMNPINELFQLNFISNPFFYMLGILIFFLIFVDLLKSLCQNIKYFYKLRSILKISIISLSHFNPTYFFSILMILDLLFIAGEYFIVKRQQNSFVNFWLIRNILLDVILAFLVFFPQKLLSIIIAMGVVFLLLIVEGYLHYVEYKKNQDLNKLASYQKANNQTFYTINNQLKDQKYSNMQRTTITSSKNAWNLQQVYENSLSKNSHKNIQANEILNELNNGPRRRQKRKNNQNNKKFLGMNGMNQNQKMKILKVNTTRYNIFSENNNIEQKQSQISNYIYQQKL